MSWLGDIVRRLTARRSEVALALRLLDRMRDVIGDARTRQQWRTRIIAGASRGDLDDVVAMLARSDTEVRDFIENG